MIVMAATIEEPRRKRLPLRKVEDLPEPPRARWYAVHTQAKKEWLANIMLREAHYWTFFPRMFVNVRHARRSEAILRPYLPRFVFAQVLPSQEFWPINELHGVSCILRTPEGEPKPMPDDQMARLIAKAAPDGLITPEEEERAPKVTFTPGEPVKVVDGPFSGFPGTVEDMDGASHVRVDLGAFVASVPVGWVVRCG